MANINKQCISIAKESLTHFTDDELYDYALRVINKSRTEKISTRDAINAIGDEVLKEMFNRNAITARNVEKFEKIAQDIRDKKTDMSALYVKRYKALGDSVEEAQRDAQHKLNEALFSKMTEEEVTYLKNNDNRNIIFQAHDGEQEVPEIAKRIAEHILST